MHFLALQCVLVSVFLGHGGKALTVRRDQGPTNSPKEYVEVTEGDTLTINCAVSHYTWQKTVYWGQLGTQNVNVWLTQNSVVETSNPRVSVNTFWDDGYFTYSMQISNVTTEDSGKYICYVTWYGSYADREGYVYVLVKTFPKEAPVCSMHQTANSTSVVSLQCDTVKGYPGVNLTWTVDGAGVDGIPQSGVVNYLDGTGREHVRTELRLNSTVWGNDRTKEFVCTVTSSKFPGLNHSCSVNVTGDRDATTEVNFDRNVHAATESGSADSGSTGDYAKTETTLEPVPRGSDATQLPAESSASLTIALVIPALLIALFTLLICVLKRKRRRKTHSGRKTPSPTDPFKARGGEVVVPYSVTQLQNDDDMSDSAHNRGGLSGEETSEPPRVDLTCRPYSVTMQRDRTTDSGVDFSNSSYETYQPVDEVIDRVTPYEVELDPTRKSAVYSEIPDGASKRGLRSTADYEAVQTARPDGEHQEGDIGYEVLNRDRTSSSTPATILHADSSGNSRSDQAPETITPIEKYGGVDDHFMDDESGEGTVINPIYESFEKGQGRALVKPWTQADDPHVYQLIN